MLILKLNNMICPNCGNENKEGAQFCRVCGKPLHTTAKNQSPSKKSGISPILIAAIAIIILVVAIGSIMGYIVYFDTSEVEILQLNTKDGGDVLQNPQIAANIPDSEISHQISEAAKSGVPIYKISDGEGPVTLITAGVHGDQLSPQVAAMELIDYLDGRKIKGTVYVIPFAAPGATADNTKLSDGSNLNTVADEAGTTSNDIVNFAKANSVGAVGDFHGTEAGKNPGVTTVMCSKVPTYGSYQLANDMAVLSLDTTWTYSVAGIQYSGAIEDVCNLNGIPAVTPLVLSVHGQVDEISVEESYSQMLALLLANGNLDPNDSYLNLANADIDG